MQTTTQPQDSNEIVTVHLKDDFYRDGFRLVLLSLGMVVAAIALLIIVSLYFFLHQVLPITFPVYPEWRVQQDVPVDQAYVRAPDLLQWISTVLPKSFSLDFIDYDEEYQDLMPYFTPTGWAKFGDLAKVIANKDDIMTKKLFLTATAGGAPVVLNQGLIDGKYAWWVQMPLNVRYSGVETVDNRDTKFVIQALLVRVPTLNNLDGIAIENIILSEQGSKH